MSNALLSVILGGMLVLSVVTATLTSDAHAKILPNSRADLVVGIDTSGREIVHEDGSITYERKFATEGNFLVLQNDVDKLSKIFDKVIVPAVDDFAVKHKTQLADKAIEQISIEYDVASNNVSVSMFGTQVYGTIRADSLSNIDRLKIISKITMRIPVSMDFDVPGNYNTLSFNILPNASVRVAYLSTEMSEILEKHKEKLITDKTYDHGVAIGKLLPSISSIMFDDMSRTIVSYADQEHGYVGRMITEYAGGVQLVIPFPPATSSLYQPVFLDVSKPVLFAKPADESIIIALAVALFGDVPEIDLTYPDAKTVSLLSAKKDTGRENEYKLVQLRCRLTAADPEGVYEVFIKAQPDKVVPQNSGTYVTKANELNVPDCTKLANVKEKIPSHDFPRDIGLFDRNGKEVEADGSVRIANQMHTDVSFVIPRQEYRLKMHIDSSPDAKTFSMYYIAKVSEYESGYTSQIKWKEVTVDATARSQEFEIPLQFEEGVYKIEAFLWNDLDNPNVVIAKPFVSNQIIKAIAIEDKRYQGESTSTLIDSTHKYLNNGFTHIISNEVIINPQGSVGGVSWGGFAFQDDFTLIVSSEQPVYGDIVYYGGDPRGYIIVKQDLSREFRIDVQIPEEQTLFNYKWGNIVLNPNDEPVTANVTTIMTNHNYQLEEGKSKSSISLIASPESVSLNDVVTLEGKIDPPHSAKVSVVMTTISLGEEVIKLTTNSNAAGEYKILFKANTAGRWDARANWEGDGDHIGANSEQVTFNVETI